MAGHGSRFLVSGYLDPKPLIPVHGIPMIELVIKNLTPNVPHRFIFICQRDHVRTYSLEEKFNVWAPSSLIIEIDGVTEGAACTVLKAKSFINNDSPLMIANSDQFINININNYLRILSEEELDGLIMTMTANDPKWSYVGFGDDKKVNCVVEKRVISSEATVGIYNFRHGRTFVSAAEKMIDEGNRVGGEFYVAPTYNYLISKGLNIGVYNIGSEGNGMHGLGTPADLEFFLSLPLSHFAANKI